jgi:hypothetical protein
MDLLGKLQIKPGVRVALLNVPAGIEAQIEGAVKLVEPGQACDAAIAFCESPADVAALAPQALTGLIEDGILWFAFRKGPAGKKAGLGRDVGWDAIKALGYEPCRAIAFDDDWSGLRFRETWRIKSRS